MIPDLVNAFFECAGALFILLSVVKLHHDKRVYGVHWVHVAFFTAWGYWNLYYYPYLEQWWSFYGGVAVVVTNTIWFCQLLWYTRK